MPNDYLAFLLVFIGLVGVACLPWDALDEHRERRRNENAHKGEERVA